LALQASPVQLYVVDEMQDSSSRCSAEDVVAAFFAAVPGAVADQVKQESECLAGLLSDAWEQARQAWPSTTLEIQPYARHLGARVAAVENEWEPVFAHLRTSDLYLACACVHQAPGALSAFESAYLEKLDLRSVVSEQSATFLDEVRQALRCRLFVGDAEHPPRICGYAGRGSLGGWVFVTARRVAFSMLRNRDSGAYQKVDVGVAVGDDFELQYFRNHFKCEFEAALKEALATLSDRERIVIHLNFVRGISLERIGMMYEVNQSTVSRWLALARQSLRKQTWQRLARRNHLDPHEISSFHRLLLDELDLSVFRLLSECELGDRRPDGSDQSET
jgi:RNA polymerase sigma-70 factor (ECF subfamily)